MSNPITRLQSRMALASHHPHSPPIILHSLRKVSPTSPSLIYHEDDARRFRWAFRLKDLDWYECPLREDGVLSKLVDNVKVERQPVLQVGRDVYYGLGAAMRALERRYPHPSLFPGDSSTARSRSYFRNQEGLSYALQSFSDNIFRPSLGPLIQSQSQPQPNTHPIHCHLQTLESMLESSQTSPTMTDTSPNRRFSVDNSSPDEPTRWEGVLPFTTHPHYVDLHLGSIARLARSIPAIRQTWTDTYPLTARWLDRLLNYIDNRTDSGVEVRLQDAIDVLSRHHTVGEVGTKGMTGVEVECEFEGGRVKGRVVNAGKWDVTVGKVVTVEGEEGRASVTCSLTVAREDIVRWKEGDAGKKQFTYVD